MKEIEVVIPIGNGDPNLDMPNSEYLEFGLKCLKNQSIPVKITCAIDEDLKKDKLEIVNKYADKIRRFGTDSYFARGGIWNKIYSCWEESDCDFVSWNGYDDYSSFDRFEKQLKKIKETKSSSCFCDSYTDSEGKLILSTKASEVDFISHLGKHLCFMGGFLIDKNKLLRTELYKHRMKWSYYFEGLLYSYIISMGLPCVSEGMAIYREHKGTISKTVFESQRWVIESRARTNYSLEETISDWNSIGFDNINKTIRENLK